MLTMMLALIAGGTDPDFDRLLLCKAYHEQWQWDEHRAGRKVPDDTQWFLAFRQRLEAAGKLKGIDRYRIAELSNAAVKPLQAGLTPEQNADWKKCQAETGWAADPSGKTIN
jgi:hypothetical protein